MNQDPRDDALAIWTSAVEAVRSDRLVADCIHRGPDTLTIGPRTFRAGEVDRLEVIGAGKAGAGMAEGLERSLGSEWLDRLRVSGWLNVPADCARELPRIHLHSARPAGRNEPRVEGELGAQEILQRVGRLGPRDVCVCLLSGGGSALLPAPPTGLTLGDLQAITQELSAAGANIHQLNSVRKRLSLIQGGRLAQACRAGVLITFIISDVIGDPLDIIASGPTVLETDERQAAQAALHWFDHFQLDRLPCGPKVRQWLQRDLAQAESTRPATDVVNLVIGNNELATAAAARCAREMGYQVQCAPPQPAESTAEDVGRELAERLLGAASERAAGDAPGWCRISGGEPVVRLVSPQQRGRGGRNQQLTLAALCRLTEPGATLPQAAALLSAGTDGEDGPTDAAGAVLDDAVLQKCRSLRLDPRDYLQRNDAYTFFEATGGLIRTGPTHTNVCDVRVALIRPRCT